MDDIDTLKRSLGHALLQARQRAGLTQRDVSTWVGLVPDVYDRIERGLALPSVPTLHQLCTVLHLSASELLGLQPGRHPASSVPVDPEDPPELVHLANLLQMLSPSEVRSLVALAAVISKNDDDEPTRH